jgi:protein-tyrosine phosphatase
LLLEFLNDQAMDLRHLVEQLRGRKVRLILAHAERVADWREKTSELEEWVRLGCLVQVTSSAFQNPTHEKVLRGWAKRGLIHLIGSDGHSTKRRPPHSRAGVQTLESWVGTETATRIASGNALAILRGDPLVLPPPEPARRGWFGRLFGN